MRLTDRDQELLYLLAVSRWLTTAQIARSCFAGITIRVLHRRLRLLRAGDYVHSLQDHPMAEALHTLGQEGKSALASRGWPREMTLERTPPRLLEHFLGINDIRIAVEKSARASHIGIRFFYACWELQERGWSFSVIPDAALRIQHGARSATVLFEYDRGTEKPSYVLRTKFRRYDQGLDGFPFVQVVTVVENVNRLEQLREYTACHLPGSDKFVFVTRHALMESWNVGALLD